MIKPINFTVDDFLVKELTPQMVKALRIENLTGSELVDNLILLKFLTPYTVQTVLRQKYKLSFGWLNNDNTPPEFKEIANRHHVIIEKGRTLVVYVPLGQAVDDAMLAIDIPNYQITYRFIADCNYRLLHNHLTVNLLSDEVANFRPLLILRRLVIDCQRLPATDLHFVCYYVNKQPVSAIQYRYQQNTVDGLFLIDFPMMHKVLQEMIAKLTPSSAMDLDSLFGVSTEVRDLFQDGTTDLRVTGAKVDAGYYIDCAIQSVTTTAKKIDELGFPEEDVAVMRSLAHYRSGLTLVSGRMRSGKNTTIFGMLNEIANEPIRIIEYSYPIENHMNFPQVNYQGDLERLSNLMRLAKKMDLDVAVLNEIPNAEVAFAVRDLVNSSVAVITTTHINRVWHMPLKMKEFFGTDYKTIISQMNAVINHKMFKRWHGGELQKRLLVKEQGEFEMFCWKSGVRQYFVPTDASAMQYSLQPLVEIVVLTPEMKTAMLNFDEIWRAEQMIQNHIMQKGEALEHKLARFINDGLMSIDEMRSLRGS